MSNTPRLAPVPDCCDLWSTLVSDGGTALRWYPHVLAARIELLTSRSAWLSYCPRCGASLPEPRIADFKKATGLAWDSPQLGMLPIERQTGALWRDDHAAGKVLWPLGLALSPHGDDAASTVRRACASAGYETRAPCAPVHVDGAGTYWLADPETVADRVISVCGADWDGLSIVATIELVGTSARRMTLARPDGALVVPGEHLAWADTPAPPEDGA